jgi:adenylate cyclase
MEEQRVQRRLAAILAADVAGYSRVTGVDAIAAHRGRIVKTTGDGILIGFLSLVDAVRCAVDVQRGMTPKR